MHLVDGFWTTLTYVVNVFVSSPVSGPGIGLQAPLLGASGSSDEVNLAGPIFKPPGGRPTGPGSGFVCDYSSMVGRMECSTPENRSCWLRNQKTGQDININSDYEDPRKAPTGIHRTYHLNVTGDQHMNADGLDFPYAKGFNNTYPGP